MKLFTTTLKLVFRNWWRNKTFTLVALLSLTVGIACINLLGAFVTYELGIEKLNPNKNRMAWVLQDLPSSPGKKVGYMVQGVPDQIKERYPEVEDFLQLGSFTLKNIVANDQEFDPIDVLNVDRSFPNFFPYQLLYGSWESFENPRSIILSERQAYRFFGNENPLGKPITLVEEGYSGSVEKQFTVGAVTKHREQSAVHFDALIHDPENAWGGPTLLLLTGEIDLPGFEEKVNSDNIPTLAGGQYYFISLDEALSLTYNDQSLTYWHTRKDTLLIVGLISALLVLLIAVFNYVNMILSGMLQRVKSIRTQKLMGATPGDIRLQLFADTFLMVFISFLFSLLLMHDLLPLFNRIVSADFSSSYFYSRSFFPYVLLFLLLLTLIPAWFMSRPSFINKKNRWTGAMVTVQFIIGIALITGMITSHRQMGLVKQGGDRYKNIIEITSETEGTDLHSFKQKVEIIPDVTGVSLGELPIMNSWIVHGMLRKENGEALQTTVLRLSGDESLSDFLQLQHLTGVEWAHARESYTHPVFVNKTFADFVEKPIESLIGEPLQKYFETSDPVFTIAGVMGDFYFNSLQEEVMAVVMELLPSTTTSYTTIRIRLDEHQNARTIKEVQRLWEQSFPTEYFTYTDVHQTFLQRNNKITEMWHLLQMYSLISILLICFGLFGISFYSVRQRTKEIGIRKINGATTSQIVWLLLKPMFTWIALGFVIGVPLAWLFMERWLQQFVYRVDVSFSTCLIALAFVALVSVITVIGQALRVAKINPAKTLKSE